MTLFHLAENGPRPCKAVKRPCPLGGGHYPDKTTALQAHENILKEEFEGNRPPEKQFSELFPRPTFNIDSYEKATNAFIAELTTEEKHALTDYVTAGYWPINEALYQQEKLTVVQQNKINAIDTALNKTVKITEPKTLWRSLNPKLAKEFLAQKHQVGSHITFHGYTSTSETPDGLMAILNDVSIYMNETPDHEWQIDPADTFKVVPPEKYTAGPARNVLFQIKARAAAPVSGLRGQATEEEWLLPKNRKFRVTAVHRNVNISDLQYVKNSGTRAQIFQLEEID